MRDELHYFADLCGYLVLTAQRLNRKDRKGIAKTDREIKSGSHNRVSLVANPSQPFQGSDCILTTLRTQSFKANPGLGFANSFGVWLEFATPSE